MRAEPGRVTPTGGKRPDASDAVAALAFDRLDLGTGSPGQHRAGIAEDRLRYRQVKISRRHRAAAGLAQAPCRGGIGLGDGFDDMEEGDGIGLDPAGGAWKQQPEKLRLVQPVQERRRQPARRLDGVGSGRDVRTHGFGTGDHRKVTRKLGGGCDRRIQDHA
jgi:hypothetical protein